MALATLPASLKELKLLDLIATGDGSRMAGCDRRTFIDWAEKLKIQPVGTIMGNKLVYKREDAERIAKAYKEHQKAKLKKNAES